MYTEYIYIKKYISIYAKSAESDGWLYHQNGMIYELSSDMNELGENLTLMR